MNNKSLKQIVVVDADNMSANGAYETAALFKENGDSIKVSTFTEPFNRLAKPFPNHLYGAYCPDDGNYNNGSCNGQVVFTQIKVIGRTDELVANATYVNGTADISYLIVAPDENGWPTKIVKSGVVENIGTGIFSINNVDLNEGIYFVALSNFDEVAVSFTCMVTNDNNYPLSNGFILPSYGTTWSDAIMGGLGYYGLTFIHATELGGNTVVSNLTEWPTEIIPGVDNGGNYYPPIVLVRAPSL